MSCVKDMRYRSQRKVKRLVPTQVSGEAWLLKTVSKPFKNAGATETISAQ